MNKLWDSFTKKRVALMIITLLIGLFIGNIIGGYTTIKAVAVIASGFVDQDLVEAAVWQYENNIKQCYPSLILNASINRNQGE